MGEQNDAPIIYGPDGKIIGSSHAEPAKVEAKARPQTGEATAVGRLLKAALSKTVHLPWWADVLTVLAFVFLLYEIAYALVPVVRPDQALSPSWEDLPITATNDGKFVAMRDMLFFCDVTNITWNTEGVPTKMRRLRAVGAIYVAVQRPPVTVAPGDTTTFPCDIATAVTANGYPSGPRLPVVLIHMRVRVNYAINLGLFIWHRSSQSQLFTWRRVQAAINGSQGIRRIKPN
jgi:hypothetical protein